ncbi:hypothetical protein LEP1GSC062_3743 [Leptospira alexanderi serovar Manhao 3 str. L 60]|uniref:Uncharacterized protein n=1 Tax=Leptospira alexanderi serovar Manhao 3 str. L 60 TaxID=1049759 RepID=V6I039_9LEPT|nr:hypothetical protein LEP1GSC062_3743 [Leptospira alexanderi serovar Manhao 3 str. L 60]
MRMTNSQKIIRYFDKIQILISSPILALRSAPILIRKKYISPNKVQTSYLISNKIGIKCRDVSA